ncbi:hypothetical protein [Chitinimonas sp.]|uniref:hypothetical protein n=1 Tax=Chitinimonas sp. TaxID=1934313 RepID=UPI0035AD82FC
MSVNQPTADTETSRVLARDEHIEIFRLTLAAGTHIQQQRAAGAMSLQCLSGTLQFHCHGKSETLSSGALIYLRNAEPLAVRWDEAAVVLITQFLLRR